jgi:PAS domain S-box-containing protein
LNLDQFRRILVVTVLLPLVLLLLLALMLAWQFQRTLREQRRIDHSDRITAQLNEMERLVVDQDTGLRSYQLTHDPTTLEPYQNAEGLLHLSFDRLMILVRDDPDQYRRLLQVRYSHEQWMGFAGKALDNMRANKLFGDTALDLNGGQMMATMRTQIGAMTKIAVHQRDEEVESTNNQVRTLMILLLVSAVGVGVTLGIFTQRNMHQVSTAFRTSLEEAHERADELYESRQWLQTTLVSIGDALIACNQHHRVELMNPVAEQLTGWTLAEAKGQKLETVYRTVHEETREPVDVSGAWPESDDPADKKHLILISRNGTEYLVDQNAGPIRGARGAAAGVVLVFRDVTDIRRRDEALMASEKLAVAGRLSASIAHEIHNPLDSVANLHYLMAKETDPNLQQRFLAMAQKELNRTLQISRAMLGLYREPKAAVEVDLRDLLESVLLLLDRQLKDRQTEVECKLADKALVQGFPGELRQVFTNLVTNAAEASGQGGRVQIRLLITADSHAGATVIVADSGPGIEESHKAKLFQPFFTTKGEKGTGLGLWVSKGIVEKHGGKITLNNSSDPAYPGAAVRVFLPALGPAVAMAGSSSFRSEPISTT